MGTPPIKVGQAKLKLDRQSSNSGQAKFQFWTRQSMGKRMWFLGVLGAFVRKVGRGKVLVLDRQKTNSGQAKF